MNKCIEDLKVLSDITKSPNYKPAAIREMLKKLDMNEKGFAVLMNVTVDTVRLGMSGVVKPCGTAMRLMQIFEAFIELIEEEALDEEDYYD